MIEFEAEVPNLEIANLAWNVPVADVGIGVEFIVGHFKSLEDPRSPINQLHPLTSVVVISIMGILAGAGGPTGIARWAEHKKEFLARVLDLPNGVPRIAQ